MENISVIQNMSFEDRHIAKLIKRTSIANGAVGASGQLRFSQGNINDLGIVHDVNQHLAELGTMDITSESTSRRTPYSQKYPLDVLLTKKSYLVGENMKRPLKPRIVHSGDFASENNEWSVENPSSLTPSESSFVRSHSDLCGITTYFNPAKYKNKYDNFKLFYDRVGKGQGLYILAVELAFTAKV